MTLVLAMIVARLSVGYKGKSASLLVVTTEQKDKNYPLPSA